MFFFALKLKQYTNGYFVSAVLDGIGKGLDPRFDITEIAKPWVCTHYILSSF